MKPLKTYKEFLTEASLTQAQLYKYDWRINLFINKLNKSDPFELNNGKTVVFKNDDEMKEVILLLKGKKPLRGIVLTTKTGQTHKFSDLKKNGEFGGIGSTTSKEDQQLESLIKQINDAKVKTAHGFINIEVDGKVYEIAGAETTPGTPKSDFHLLDKDGNEVIWISHKDGKSAKDFQQWGGMTEKKIKNHSEVVSFAKDVNIKFPDGIPRKTTVARKIKDKVLQNKSVYGVDFDGKTGRQNTSILLQGPVGLKKSGDTYTLTANNVHYKGDLMTGDFEPVMMAIYKGDRSNFGVKGARFAIQPKSSRKVHEWI